MTRAELFDLGNTLVRYYRRDEFLPILRECLRCATAAVHDKAADIDSLFEKALELNHEADDFAVRRLDAAFYMAASSLLQFLKHFAWLKGYETTN